MNNIFEIFFVCSNLLIFSSGFDVTLNVQKDLQPTYGWSLSKARPPHYINSVSDLDEAFLPINLESLPQGDGIWILRYKDFSNLPKKFPLDGVDQSKSFIKYTSKAQLFNKVTLKALIVGDVKLDLDLGSGSEPQKVSLSSMEECSKVSKVDEFQWTTYEILTTSPSSHVCKLYQMTLPNNTSN